jgi:uncharacterized RDD family membrane protein YckC
LVSAAGGGLIAAMETGAPPPERPRSDEPGAAGPSEPPPAAPQAPAAPEAPPGAPAAPAGYASVPQEWAGPPLSGWWRRVGAYLIDGLIISILISLGWLFVVNGNEVLGAILGLVGLLLAFFYWPLTMAREGPENGQSLGKQALGIRVARDTGEPVTFGFALLRQFVVIYLLFQVVGGVLFGLPWLIDVLWPLWDRENRALHDMIVKSHVLVA